MKIGVPFAKWFLVPLAIMISASAIDGAIQTKMREESIAKAGKKSIQSYQIEIWIIL